VDINAISQGVGELNFEEEEEDQFYMKDLPKHACASVLSSYSALFKVSYDKIKYLKCPNMHGTKLVDIRKCVYLYLKRDSSAW
jgi:hypothetical protein